MAKVIVGMTISLDEFVADQNGNVGGLYSGLATLRHTAYLKDAIEQTGAVRTRHSLTRGLLRMLCRIL